MRNPEETRQKSTVRIDQPVQEPLQVANGGLLARMGSMMIQATSSSVLKGALAHLDRRKGAAVPLEPLELDRFDPVKQVIGQLFTAEISRQIPVVPPVIAANNTRSRPVKPRAIAPRSHGLLRPFTKTSISADGISH